MADNKGIKQAVLKVVKDAGRPVSAREVITMTSAALSGVDVLNKSVRAMLTMAANDGVLHKKRLSNGRNVVYSATPLRPAKGSKGVKSCGIRCVGITDVSKTVRDVTITVRLPANMSVAVFMSRVEESLVMPGF